MRRIGSIVVVLLAATACASGSSEPATPIAWDPGRYVLEAAITYNSGGRNQVERHTADLVIDQDGTIELTSSQGGLCLDPSPSEMGADQARGRRTFVCGNVSRYELRPVAGSVTGEMFAEVTEEELQTVCVRYATSAEGQQVCVQTEERIVKTTAVKRARLQVSLVP